MPPPIIPSSGGWARGNQDDVVIAVMGSTGTGKSSFIKLLTGNTNIKIGNTLESETSDIQIIRVRDPTSGRNITIVDTPGFDDSRAGVTDTDILKTITKFLLEEYDKDRKLTGLIYLTRISDPRFSGQSSRNLRMFRSLCGTESYKNVVVLTTFWDQVPAEDGVGREQELESRIFEDLVEGGARFMRHNRTIESARQVLGHVLTLAPANVQIQEEIRVQGKTLEDTAAGSVHREEVQRIIARHKAEVAELKSEMMEIKQSNEAARRELEEERAKLLRALARWEKEKMDLREGLNEERRSRKQLEVKAAEEKKNHEQWRVEQERKWSSQMDSQAKAHATSLKGVQDQYVVDKRTLESIRQEQQSRSHAESVRMAVNRALAEERKKPLMQRGLDLAEDIPLPNFIGKPILGIAGFALDGVKSVVG